jgi:hypothetical protein
MRQSPDSVGIPGLPCRFCNPWLRLVSSRRNDGQTEHDLAPAAKSGTAAGTICQAAGQIECGATATVNVVVASCPTASDIRFAGRE